MEYEVLIDICRHYLNGDKFIFDTDVNYKKLFLYAKGYNLLGVLHCAVLNAKNKSDLPENFLNALENKFFDLIFLSNAQINMLEEVKTLLFFAFKTAQCNTPKRLYPFAYKNNFL